MAATAAGLNHLISFPKKVQVHFGQDTIKATFNDPGIDQSLNMLSPEQKAFASSFKTGVIEVTAENSRMLRDIINTLSNGFEKVELTAVDMANVFNKPMGLDEAKTVFEQFIENQCAGKERSKIRIIFSGK